MNLRKRKSTTEEDTKLIIKNELESVSRASPAKRSKKNIKDVNQSKNGIKEISKSKGKASANSINFKKEVKIEKENLLLKNIAEDIQTNSIDIDVNKKVKSKLEKKGKTSSKSSKKEKDTPVNPPLKYESLGPGPAPVPYTGKKYVGCHVSAAGGVWNCFENGEKCEANAMALFLRNQRSWNAKPLDQEAIDKWNKAIKDFPPHLILPHGSYLMNLGSPKKEILDKSRTLFVEELRRCQSLGIPHFNFHPGSCLGEISREECCRLIAESINLAHEQTEGVICVIENMSKQGFTLGGDLHEIRLIIEGVRDRTRVGVCIDTCHAHAAGYDLASVAGFDRLLGDFERIIGWQFLRGMHLNDSKGETGDRKDRHELIGKGTIGTEGFRRLMNHPRFDDIPLILETPFVSEGNYAKETEALYRLVEKDAKESH